MSESQVSQGAAGISGVELRELLSGRSLVIASNRGPVAFERGPAGKLVARRGAGGLVTALTHVMVSTGGLWVAAAMTPGDREMVRSLEGRHIAVESDGSTLSLRYLVFEREIFDRYYNHISNRVFWFMNHSMWNLPLHPNFDSHTLEAWECYRKVNKSFARALAEEVRSLAPGSPVMLHDYHLMLAAGYLREIIPDALVYHFTHSPWPPPDQLSVLPGTMASEVLEGMLANDLLGFQTVRWVRNFLWCCQEVLGTKVDMEAGRVRLRERETLVRHYPISVDCEALRTIASSEEAGRHLEWLDGILMERRLVLRVDRLELSKNIIRGLKAFEELLKAHPEWRGQVTHLALLYPSRRALREYRAYEVEIFDKIDGINSELGSDDWQPVVMVNEDNYCRALACLSRYDVLVVNPIADGMNLVSKEGPAVNQNDGVLILSRNAGSWYELEHAAISVNPYDVTEMAEAIHTALTMDVKSRRRRARVAREVVER
ncbi:MAG: alpha,alpha-trehalose-phosphate synthase (UDP-forming), partial [Actinomycetota bacterium]